MVAMYEDNAIPTEPVEQWWYHAAGASGYGSSSYIDDVVLRDRDTTANGTLDERLYYLQNQHHDVVALCDTAGDVEERVNYDAYGSPIGTFSLPGAVGNRKGYAGYEYDAVLGETYHVRNRVYRSDLGVWTRRDPLNSEIPHSAYLYVAGNAPRFLDPSGLAKHVFVFDGFTSTLVKTHWVPIIEGESGVVHYYSERIQDVKRAIEEAKRIAKEEIETENCATRYHTISGVGYSWGGDAAMKFAAALASERIRVNLGFTDDPVPKPLQADPEMNRPPCTDRWVNFYQKVDPVTRGHAVHGADVNRRLHEFDFTDATKAHIEIASHPLVLTQALSCLQREIAQLPDTRGDYRC